MTFGATLRSETDLAESSQQVLAVVEEAMQPAHMSLWLRPPKHRSDHALRQLDDETRRREDIP